jgi:hypothetical protein
MFVVKEEMGRHYLRLRYVVGRPLNIPAVLHGYGSEFKFTVLCNSQLTMILVKSGYVTLRFTDFTSLLGF